MRIEGEYCPPYKAVISARNSDGPNPSLPAVQIHSRTAVGGRIQEVRPQAPGGRTVRRGAGAPSYLSLSLSDALDHSCTVGGGEPGAPTTPPSSSPPRTFLDITMTNTKIMESVGRSARHIASHGSVVRVCFGMRAMTFAAPTLFTKASPSHWTPECFDNLRFSRQLLQHIGSKDSFSL